MRNVRAAVLFAVSVLFLPLAEATPITIDVPGSNTTFVTGINDAGDFVGQYVGSGNQGFIYRTGTFQEIAFAGAEQGVFPLSINNLGQVAGYYVPAAGGIHGFIWSSSGVTTIDVPGGTDTFVTGINDTGDLVGHYSQGSNRAFLFSQGAFYEITIPNTDQGVFPQEINNLGQVVGYFVPGAGGTHGFVWSPSGAVTIDGPGGSDTFVTGINDAGGLVGHYSLGSIRAFVLHGAEFDDILIAGAGQGVFPQTINNLGQVGGYYVADNGRIHGFVTSVPVSEPSALALVGIGILGLLSAGRRSRATSQL